ncbi:MAG: HlyC/CorC family transporter [Acidobacteriales bacterium]|nr:HlyC/CorC family transporter [Terriglobales bacterium]
MISLALFNVFLVILLVAANAFFVAAEFALVSIRETRIQQLLEARRVGARTVQRLHKNLDEVLSAVQFGITLASIALGWVGEPTLARGVEKLLAGIPNSATYSHIIALGIAFAIITALHVILGEVVPKSLALQRAERIALAVATPMDVFMKFSRPALYFLNKSSNLVLRGLGARQVREGGVHSPDELKLIVTASSKVGLLPELQEDMIHRALELENITVREIMVPRPEIFSLPSSMTVEDAMRRVVEEQHSRVPVYDAQKGPEHIVGLLYSKDLSRLMHLKLISPEVVAQSMKLSVANVMRDVMVVPETKPVSDLLQEFKKRKRHLAVVVDEFGSTSGVVTVEDALEQIVGSLEDEFDVAEQPLHLSPGGGLILDGAENILDLESRHKLRIPRDKGFETLAGFLLYKLGRIPQGGESLEHDGHRYTVLGVKGHRIDKVKIELTVPSEAPAEALPAAQGD